jgi:sensor histidine kinase YesM
MGIANVKERLETCFGPEAGFVIESEPGSFMRTRITIPMEEEADAENSDRGR